MKLAFLGWSGWRFRLLLLHLAHHDISTRFTVGNAEIFFITILDVRQLERASMIFGFGGFLSQRRIAFRESKPGDGGGLQNKKGGAVLVERRRPSYMWFELF
jgi:hypothetical protein